jgi:hypothetical protein
MALPPGAAGGGLRCQQLPAQLYGGVDAGAHALARRRCQPSRLPVRRGSTVATEAQRRASSHVAHTAPTWHASDGQTLSLLCSKSSQVGASQPGVHAPGGAGSADADVASAPADVFIVDDKATADAAVKLLLSHTSDDGCRVYHAVDTEVRAAVAQVLKRRRS